MQAERKLNSDTVASLSNLRLSLFVIGTNFSLLRTHNLFWQAPDWAVSVCVLCARMGH